MTVQVRPAAESASGAARRAIIAAHNPPYIPLPRAADHVWEIEMQHGAAQLILSAHPERWHDWVQDAYPQHMETDTAKHIHGTILLYEDRLDVAETALHDALQWRERMADHERQASSLVNLSEIAFHRGDMFRAWTILKQALALDPVLPVVHVNRVCVAKAVKSSVWRTEALQALHTHLPDWKDNGFVAEGVVSYRMHATCMR